MDRDHPLRLSDRFSHIVQAGGATVLVGDEDGVLIDHPQATRVVQLLDGLRSATDVAEALSAETRPEVTHFALLCLERAGIVEPVRRDGSGPRGATTSLSPAVVSLAQALRTAWEGRAQSLVATMLPRLPGLRLVLVQDYLGDEVREVVRSGSSGPQLLIRLGRRSAWIGPRLLPGGRPCIACLQERLRLNLTGHALLHARHAGSEVHIGPLPGAVRPEIFDWVAEQLVEDSIGTAEGTAPATLRVRTGDGGGAHVVSPLPHCELCGDPTLTVAGPEIQLRPVPWGAPTLAGYRIRSPQETLDRFAHLLSPLTGVVRHIRRVPVHPPDTQLLHVYTASHALEYRSVSVGTMREDRRDPSGGKGRTDPEAKASALCESLERFSSVHRGSEPCRRARLSDLGPGALPPNDIMLFSDRQFRDRAEWNRHQAGRFQYVPEPYDDEVIEWCELRSLATGAVVLAPASSVFFGFRGAGAAFGDGDSNGLAAGNCLEEALLQAFFELVERDAVAIWWYNRIRRPAIDLASFEDPYIDQVSALYRSLGRSLWALDLTTDLRIPCVAALSHVDDGAGQDIIFGFGAHLDVHIALSRALTELNQMLPTIQRSREERRRQLLPDFRDAVEWWDEASIESETYLVLSEERPRERGDFPAATHRELRACVLECVERARGIGSDVLAYDLTRADVGLPVVRVIAPGLRHFWRRLAPGRLYDVPVRMGWLRSPVAEEDMNPVSMFV